MNEIRKFIEESLEVIKKRAFENQIQGGFFSGLCEMLIALEQIAQEYLKQDDSLLKEITDLKKILCKT
ncbi:hypothetical protein [uncultured Polaribacter sp.]|uniref:hypothetical protein n=1 Tax=uncultured Polaribacter sp. TaxID=174711 RepID=UPI00262A17E0|nr:hypothetical protein [uncultured Polaribacter sp.]